MDLIVLGISSKGIEWVADQLSRLFKDGKIPKLLMLTKGLSIYKNQYELLVDKLERLLADRGIKKIDISDVGDNYLGRYHMWMTKLRCHQYSLPVHLLYSHLCFRFCQVQNLTVAVTGNQLFEQVIILILN